MSNSIYESICDNLRPDDTLPDDFRISKAASSGKLGIRLVEGALDGMYLYHDMQADSDEEALIDVINEASGHDFDSAEYDLESFFSAPEVRMLPLVEKLERWVNDNAGSIDAEAVFQFAANVIIKTDNPEALKFALVLFEMMDTDDNEAVKDVVKALSRSEELTLFSIMVAETWKDGNDAILDFAKHTKGWGRIHCVEHIEASSGKIKDWLFREGVRNNVGAAYSARTVAEKINLGKVFLNPAFNDDDYLLARPIIAGLLDEGTLQGISLMSDRTEILSGFIKQSEHRVKTTEALNTLLDIRDYLNQNIFNESGKLGEKLEHLLNSKELKDFASKLVTEKKDFRLAKRMDIDCTEEVLAAMEEDFAANASLVDILPKNSETLSKVFSIFRKKLPLDMMASGPKDNLGIGEEYRPFHQLSFLVQNLSDSAGEGEDFIVASLNSPVNGTRQMALSVLEEWLKDNYVPSNAVKYAVWHLKEAEPSGDIRALLEKIDI
ncbi:hypothetical protein [Oribacterium sp. NK2B42]|uniref:hypothetical protein n=1 Tax=Oribacterium sp. NK2B42 TaxID=689781 RepID=UPI0003F8CF95|nr:hypothetical protein [Oribacterium sp. NK2B42]